MRMPTLSQTFRFTLIYSSDQNSGLVRYSDGVSIWIADFKGVARGKVEEFHKLVDYLNLNTVGIWIPTIWIQNFLKFGFQMVRYSNGRSKAKSYVPDQPFKFGTNTTMKKLEKRLQCACARRTYTVGYQCRRWCCAADNSQQEIPHILSTKSCIQIDKNFLTLNPRPESFFDNLN